MVSDADTPPAPSITSYLPSSRGHIDLWSAEVETKSSAAPRCLSFKKGLCALKGSPARRRVVGGRKSKEEHSGKTRRWCVSGELTWKRVF